MSQTLFGIKSGKAAPWAIGTVKLVVGSELPPSGAEVEAATVEELVVGVASARAGPAHWCPAVGVQEGDQPPRKALEGGEAAWATNDDEQASESAAAANKRTGSFMIQSLGEI